MKKNDQYEADDEKPVELTIYKPDDQVYQKLHLCEYLRELDEPAENESEPLIGKKDFRRHLHKDRE